MIKKIFIHAILLLAVMLYSGVAYAGFGVSPAEVNEDNLVPGAKLENIIYLVQGDPLVDLKVKATVESQEIDDWFHFSQGDEFTIPAGIQQFPLEVQVQVPKEQLNF